MINMAVHEREAGESCRGLFKVTLGPAEKKLRKATQLCRLGAGNRHSYVDPM